MAALSGKVEQQCIIRLCCHLESRNLSPGAEQYILCTIFILL